MTVVPFPITPDHALALVRAAAQAGRVIYPCLEGESPWYALTTRRQVAKCLREGALLGNPATNALGDVECTLGLFRAGVDVSVDVVIRDVDGITAIIVHVRNTL